MQSDSHESDPRLQKTNPGPRVATGYVDPCIVYLETTLPGEIPLLAACWAASSQEVRSVGRPSQLKLANVVVVKGQYRRMLGGKLGWSFTTHREKTLTLKHHETGCPTITGFPLLGSAEQAHPLVFQWAIRFIDQETNASLRKAERSGIPGILVKSILECSKPDWISITDALASFEPEKVKSTKVPTKRIRSKSLLRRLISSVFKKKQLPVGS